MSPKRIKFPQASSGSLLKTPPVFSENYDTQTPVFSLEHMVNGYCVESCDESQKAHFAMALFKRRGTTWRELKQSYRHGIGCEKIPRNQMKVAIPAKVTPDVDFLAFRCINKAPMIGYRENRIFHILWIDKDFSVYDH